MGDGFVGDGRVGLRQGRPGHDRGPQTKEKMHIPAKKVPSFSAGNALKDLIRYEHRRGGVRTFSALRPFGAEISSP